MSKHADGPWGIARSETGPWAIFGANGNWIATTTKKQFPNEDEANARLIAAAPELLEALEGVIEYTALLDDVTQAAIRSAIAKALGES